MPSRVAMVESSYQRLKKAMSSGHCSRAWLKMCFRKSSASSARPSRSQESHLGLHHPELGQVARGVGVLGPEGGAECIDVGEGQGENLGLQLAADGEVGGLPEEVLGVIHQAVAAGRVLQVQGGDPEHGTGSLGVAGGDHGRLDVLEAALLEEVVDGVGHGVAHPGHGAEGVGAGPQVGDFPQEFQGMTLLLEGVFFRVGLAQDFQPGWP